MKSWLWRVRTPRQKCPRRSHLLVLTPLAPPGPKILVLASDSDISTPPASGHSWPPYGTRAPLVAPKTNRAKSCLLGRLGSEKKFGVSKHLLEKFPWPSLYPLTEEKSAQKFGALAQNVVSVRTQFYAKNVRLDLLFKTKKKSKQLAL